MFEITVVVSIVLLLAALVGWGVLWLSMAGVGVRAPGQRRSPKPLPRYEGVAGDV